MTYVAVYGSLKKGFHNHVYLHTAKHIGSGVVKGYEMYSLGAYPMIVHSEASKKVHVEVYKVSQQVMDRLDCLEGYPSFYDRCIREVVVDGVPYRCWIYFGEMDMVDDRKLVADGNWKQPTYA